MDSEKCKCKETETDMVWTAIHDINTFQVADNELYLGGINEFGQPITVVFNAREILEWIDIGYVREKVIEHYSEINREEAENLKKSKQK